jgi:hypothetical protein
MFFVGAGTSSGVAVVGLLTWKLYKRMDQKQQKKMKRSVV